MSINAKRLIAGFIDFYIICFIMIISSYTIFFRAKYLSFYQSLAFFILTFILVLIKDKVFGNASIGKRILKIKVIKENGEKLTVLTSVKRNLSILLLPLEILLIITDNKRLGDMWAKTTVVER